MTPDEYQSLARRTAPTPFENVEVGERLEWMPELYHAQLGIASEAGELADALKKHIAYNRQLDLTNLREELGDIMWYVALGASAIGASLEDLMEENIQKLRLRYPEKFTEKDALERKDKEHEQ